MFNNLACPHDLYLSGPLLMACGGLLCFGSCGFFAFAFYAASKDEHEYSIAGSKHSMTGGGHRDYYDDDVERK